MDQSETHRLAAERRLVIIQRNPTSGSGRGRQELRALIRELRRADLTVRLFANRDRLDEFVQTCADSEVIRCLVAAGGDGTVASLAQRHPCFPIALLPMGTENLVARHLKIPRCGVAAADTIIHGATQVFDTGFVNGQRFLLMVSVGIDADVVHRLNAVRTGNIRHSSYIKPILDSFRAYDFPEVSVHTLSGDVVACGTHVVVTNIPEYGFQMPFSPHACPHDAKLDVRVFQRTGSLTTMWHALKTRLGAADKDFEVHRCQLSQLEIRSQSSRVPIQCDGDPGDFCPASIQVAPASMTLVVPADKLRGNLVGEAALGK